MKSSLAFFLLTFFAVFPALPVSAVPAAAETKKLTDLALTKRAAALVLSGKELVAGRAVYGLGVFISADGLALVSLNDISSGIRPSIETADGADLPLGTILGLFPDQELALVKFKHRPKAWIPLASKEPAVNEPLAVAGLCYQGSWEEKVPPVTGPVMSKRSAMGGNLREPQFRRVLSLGSGLTLLQREAFVRGTFAINRQGELAAVFAGIEFSGQQKLILFHPVSTLAASVAAMVKKETVIPFPIPAATNPIDPVLDDPAHDQWIEALQRGDLVEAKRIREELLKRFPDNFRVQNLPRLSPDDAADVAKTPPLSAKFSPAARVARLMLRSNTLDRIKDDKQGALKEMLDALAIAPKDFPDIRVNLAVLYRATGEPDKGEAYLREAIAIAPESTEIIQYLERALMSRDKIDEARQLATQLYEMEDLYRTKY